MHLVDMVKGGVSEGMFQDALSDWLGEEVRRV